LFAPTGPECGGAGARVNGKGLERVGSYPQRRITRRHEGVQGDVREQAIDGGSVGGQKEAHINSQTRGGA